MSEALILPDLKRCQAEITKRNPWVMGGPVVTRTRCESAPTVIATENAPGPDGAVGSMSLCESCAAVMRKQLGETFARFTPIADEQRLYRVPALFWLDHEERQPCDRPEQIAELQSIQGRTAFVMANAEQVACLRGDAEFYAQGNVDGCPGLVRSARATLEVLDKAA